MSSTAKQFIAQAYKEGGVPHTTAKHYNTWAKGNQYDEHLIESKYKGPQIAAETVAEFFPTQSDRDKVIILDVAAGTGFVGEHLQTLGFKHVDALDPSEGMLEKAYEKNLYERHLIAYVDTNKLPILPDTYDCAVSCGAMGEGHIPYEGLDQLIRVVKPGGYIVTVMREEYLQHSQYKGKLEPHMRSLEEKGLWKLVSRRVIPEYCLQYNGLSFIHKVLTTGFAEHHD